MTASPALWLLGVTAVALTAISISLVLRTLAQLGSRYHLRPDRHICVAIALVPWSVLLSYIIHVGYTTIRNEGLKLATAEILPSPLAFMVSNMAPLDEIPGVCLTDVQTLVCMLFVTYGFHVVRGHLIDIVRLLRLSYRRCLVPGEELQREIDSVVRSQRQPPPPPTHSAPASFLRRRKR